MARNDRDGIPSYVGVVATKKRESLEYIKNSPRKKELTSMRLGDRNSEGNSLRASGYRL